MAKIGVLVVDLAVLVTAPVTAQRRAGSGYDPRSTETASGEVVSVERIVAREGRSGGVHIMLKTERERVPVHLGPAWYVEKQNVRVERGDKIEVAGSRVTEEGKPALIARQVKKGGATLTLRDSRGVPAWAGRGRRR